MTEDKKFMSRALALAQAAADVGEVPVGAVLVKDGEVIAEGHNRPLGANDPTAHAEIQTLRTAGAKLNNYRMTGSTMYVTLEPCPMCVGAMIHARVERVVFAAFDPKTGAMGSAMDLACHESHNHRMQSQGGVMADEAAAMIRQFFRQRR